MQAAKPKKARGKQQKAKGNYSSLQLTTEEAPRLKTKRPAGNAPLALPGNGNQAPNPSKRIKAKIEVSSDDTNSLNAQLETISITPNKISSLGPPTPRVQTSISRYFPPSTAPSNDSMSNGGISSSTSPTITSFPRNSAGATGFNEVSVLNMNTDSLDACSQDSHSSKSDPLRRIAFGQEGSSSAGFPHIFPPLNRALSLEDCQATPSLPVSYFIKIDIIMVTVMIIITFIIIITIITLRFRALFHALTLATRTLKGSQARLHFMYIHSLFVVFFGSV
jgi:hypothetical protein